MQVNCDDCYDSCEEEEMRGWQGMVGPSATGPQGPQGFVGPDYEATSGSQGFEGSLCACDPQDFRGQQGFEGLQGPSIIGADGDIGPQGSQRQGYQGPQGDKGQTGPQGLDVRGPQGDVGDVTQLYQGRQGFQGSQLGTQGPSGPQGPLFEVMDFNVNSLVFFNTTGNFFASAFQPGPGKYLYTLCLSVQSTTSTTLTFDVVQNALTRATTTLTVEASQRATICLDSIGDYNDGSLPFDTSFTLPVMSPQVALYEMQHVFARLE